MKPRILDPNFKYTRAVETDIRKTFARERKRLALLKAKRQQNEAEAQTKVKTLKVKQ